MKRRSKPNSDVSPKRVSTSGSAKPPPSPAAKILTSRAIRGIKAPSPTLTSSSRNTRKSVISKSSQPSDTTFNTTLQSTDSSMNTSTFKKILNQPDWWKNIDESMLNVPAADLTGNKIDDSVLESSATSSKVTTPLKKRKRTIRRASKGAFVKAAAVAERETSPGPPSSSEEDILGRSSRSSKQTDKDYESPSPPHTNRRVRATRKISRGTFQREMGSERKSDSPTKKTSTEVGLKKKSKSSDSFDSPNFETPPKKYTKTRHTTRRISSNTFQQELASERQPSSPVIKSTTKKDLKGISRVIDSPLIVKTQEKRKRKIKSTSANIFHEAVESVPDSPITHQPSTSSTVSDDNISDMDIPTTEASIDKRRKSKKRVSFSEINEEFDDIPEYTQTQVADSTKESESDDSLLDHINKEKRTPVKKVSLRGFKSILGSVRHSDSPILRPRKSIANIHDEDTDEHGDSPIIPDMYPKKRIIKRTSLGTFEKAMGPSRLSLSSNLTRQSIPTIVEDIESETESLSEEELNVSKRRTPIKTAGRSEFEQLLSHTSPKQKSRLTAPEVATILEEDGEDTFDIDSPIPAEKSRTRTPSKKAGFGEFSREMDLIASSDANFESNGNNETASLSPRKSILSRNSISAFTRKGPVRHSDSLIHHESTGSMDISDMDISDQSNKISTIDRANAQKSSSFSEKRTTERPGDTTFRAISVDAFATASPNKTASGPQTESRSPPQSDKSLPAYDNDATVSFDEILTPESHKKKSRYKKSKVSLGAFTQVLESISPPQSPTHAPGKSPLMSPRKSILEKTQATYSPSEKSVFAESSTKVTESPWKSSRLSTQMEISQAEATSSTLFQHPLSANKSPTTETQIPQLVSQMELTVSQTEVTSSTSNSPPMTPRQSILKRPQTVQSPSEESSQAKSSYKVIGSPQKSSLLSTQMDISQSENMSPHKSTIQSSNHFKLSDTTLTANTQDSNLQLKQLTVNLTRIDDIATHTDDDIEEVSDESIEESHARAKVLRSKPKVSMGIFTRAVEDAEPSDEDMPQFEEQIDKSHKVIQSKDEISLVPSLEKATKNQFTAADLQHALEFLETKAKEFEANSESSSESEDDIETETVSKLSKEKRKFSLSDFKNAINTLHFESMTEEISLTDKRSIRSSLQNQGEISTHENTSGITDMLSKSLIVASNTSVELSPRKSMRLSMSLHEHAQMRDHSKSPHFVVEVNSSSKSLFTRTPSNITLHTPQRYSLPTSGSNLNRKSMIKKRYTLLDLQQAMMAVRSPSFVSDSPASTTRHSSFSKAKFSIRDLERAVTTLRSNVTAEEDSEYYEQPNLPLSSPKHHCKVSTQETSGENTVSSGVIQNASTSKDTARVPEYDPLSATEKLDASQTPESPEKELLSSTTKTLVVETTELDDEQSVTSDVSDISLPVESAASRKSKKLSNKIFTLTDFEKAMGVASSPTVSETTAHIKSSLDTSRTSNSSQISSKSVKKSGKKHVSLREFELALLDVRSPSIVDPSTAALNVDLVEETFSEVSSESSVAIAVSKVKKVSSASLIAQFQNVKGNIAVENETNTEPVHRNIEENISYEKQYKDEENHGEMVNLSSDRNTESTMNKTLSKKNSLSTTAPKSPDKSFSKQDSVVSEAPKSPNNSSSKKNTSIAETPKSHLKDNQISETEKSVLPHQRSLLSSFLTETEPSSSTPEVGDSSKAATAVEEENEDNEHQDGSLHKSEHEEFSNHDSSSSSSSSKEEQESEDEEEELEEEEESVKSVTESEDEDASVPQQSGIEDMGHIVGGNMSDVSTEPCGDCGDLSDEGEGTPTGNQQNFYGIFSSASSKESDKQVSATDSQHLSSARRDLTKVFSQETENNASNANVATSFNANLSGVGTIERNPQSSEDFKEIIMNYETYIASVKERTKTYSKNERVNTKKQHVVVTKKKSPVKRVVAPERIIDGKEYRKPRLSKPKPWVTDRLYRRLINQFSKKDQLRSHVLAENFVTNLVEQVTHVIRCKSKIEEKVKRVAKMMKKVNLVEDNFEFFCFSKDYLPDVFVTKAFPYKNGTMPKYLDD